MFAGIIQYLRVLIHQPGTIESGHKRIYYQTTDEGEQFLDILGI